MHDENNVQDELGLHYSVSFSIFAYVILLKVCLNCTANLFMIFTTQRFHFLSLLNCT